MAFVNSIISPLIKANRGVATTQVLTGSFAVSGAFTNYGKWAPTVSGTGGALGSHIGSVPVYNAAGTYLGRCPYY